MIARSPVVAYGAAILALAAAVLLRWLLDPVLVDHLPLVTLFAAVAVAVWLGGYRAALLVVILGYLACDYLFVEPRGSLGHTSARNLVGLLAYLGTCAVIVGLGEAMRRARVRADERRELLRVTFSSIGDAVITTDNAGRITFLNAVAESLTGWRNEEAAGQPLTAVFRIVNEQTRHTVENPTLRALSEGVIVGLANHTVLLAKDGTERAIDDSAAPIRDEHGRIAGCVLIFRDVTQRRRLEQENARRLAASRLLAAIVESSHDAIISKSLDGIIESWNAAAEQLLGYTADQAIGRHISLIIPSSHADEEVEIIQRLRAGERIEHFETVRLRSDGQPIHASLTISPIRDEEGHIIGASKILRDITEKRAAESQIFGLLGELAEADRRKDVFLATLAHELRNPLAPIRNAVQLLLLKGPPDPELQWAREVIDRQVQHMARLLDDLLDVSRISHNKLELRKERLELAAVIRSAAETSRPLIDKDRHELSVILPPEPVYLDADPVRLAQVLSNLLSNAAKYTEAGGHIRLTGERQGNDVVISVKDDGIGIAPERLPRIFDLFSQEKPALDRSQGGLGIGLSLVCGLVELHGGSIEARSDGLGKGSEFVVRLPAVPTEAIPAVALRSDETEQASSSKRRVLIVDDLKDSADSLAVLLEMKGHEVHTAYDGEQAVAAAQEFKPEVVLLDIGMPKLNGYDACRAIREQPWGKEMFLVALTGWGQEGDFRRTQEAGFNLHMVKPVDPADLLKLLASLASEPA